MQIDFKKYIAESKKTYNFKVGLAGMLADDTGDRLESLMTEIPLTELLRSWSWDKKDYRIELVKEANKILDEKYNYHIIPIQKKALDFPALENTEVTYFDIEVEYPTTTSVLEQYLKDSLGLPANHVVVRKPGDPLVAIQEEPKANGDKKANLESDYPKSDSAATKTAGDSRVMELLKELEKVRKDRDAPDAAKDVKVNPEGNKGIMEK